MVYRGSHQRHLFASKCKKIPSFVKICGLKIKKLCIFSVAFEFAVQGVTRFLTGYLPADYSLGTSGASSVVIQALRSVKKYKF